METELVIASSPTDAGISCWNFQTGAEYFRYKTCSSPPHGLVSVAGRFLASSQLLEPKSSSSGSILYWSWNKAEVKSFPAEPIKPLVSNSEGTYIVGGEDGCVRVWYLYMIFGGANREGAKHPYEYSFHEHTLKVTDVKSGYGCNAIIVSASEDRTCKVWSLSKGKLLRNIVFPSIIDAIALDPGEHVIYAGGRDGKIFIAALNAPGTSNSSYGLHIIGSLSEHSKAITCLASSADGSLLVSGSEDGMIRVWNTKSHNITRVFRHAKGPVNNVLVVRQPQHLNPGTSINTQASLLRGRGFLLPPSLQKYVNSADENAYVKAFLTPQTASNTLLHDQYISVQTMENLIKEHQKQGSSAAAELDVERLKLERQRSVQTIQQSKTIYENLHQFCVNELLDGNHVQSTNG